jgi:hypothetical protein
MNKANLLLMAELIKTIPQDIFDMSSYRQNRNDECNHKCNTIGCVIGHCTVLDKVENLPRYENNEISFVQWSQNFTGLIGGTNEWHFLFSGDWVKSDNTPKGASNRIKYFVENGLPKDWEGQVLGQTPLCYN